MNKIIKDSPNKKQFNKKKPQKFWNVGQPMKILQKILTLPNIQKYLNIINAERTSSYSENVDEAPNPSIKLELMASRVGVPTISVINIEQVGN